MNIYLKKSFIYLLLFFTFTQVNGQCISGDCKNGYGVDVDKEDGSRYEGTFKNGKYSGKGKCVWNTGSTYIGEYENGLCHGYGVYKAADGKVLDGEFFKNRFLEPVVKQPKTCISGDCENGYGIAKYNFGSYEGQFKDGNRNGKGSFEYTAGQFTGNKYVGDFYKDAFNGYGKITYTKSLYTDYYEGEFINNKRDGYGKSFERDGVIYEGNFSGGIFYGLGKKIKDGFGNLAYWDNTELDNTKSLPLNLLKYHQDTTFNKFKKCDCLQRNIFSILGWAWEGVSYDLISTYTGKKVGEKTETDLGFNNLSVNGFVNNTKHNIYIKCYRKFYYKERNITEYTDDSYIVYPGQSIMANYRIQPQPGELYAMYFDDEFFYLGQYCDKSVDECKSSPKTTNGFALSITGPIITSDKLIKKGNKVTIIATGSVKVGSWAGYSSPEGIDGYQSYNKIQGFKHGSLLAKIGDAGKWFLVGKSISFTAATDGKIQFLINDADYTNNTGSYEVEISVK
jgi:hypothetical protein